MEKAFAWKTEKAKQIDDPFKTDRVDMETEYHLPAGLLKRSFPDRYQDYYSACFVRNPWDYVTSCYAWLRFYRKIPHEFNDWVKRGFLDTPEREMNIFMKPNQSDWITDENGEIIVDFVGRFENMRQDFKKICRKVGVRKKLPHINRFKRAHYSTVYDDEARDIVADWYRRDVELLKYTFEETTPLTQTKISKILKIDRLVYYKYPPIRRTRGAAQS